MAGRHDRTHHTASDCNKQFAEREAAEQYVLHVSVFTVIIDSTEAIQRRAKCVPSMSMGA